MVKNEELYLTAEGKQKYEEELTNLIEVVQQQVIQEIVEAKAQGDLSENADYDAARNKQAEVEGRINYLKNLLNNAKIISNTNSNIIGLGSKIQIVFKDTNEVENYIICGPAEADPEEGKISNVCKLAQTLMGHKVGETVNVKVDEPYDVLIVDIQ